VNGKGRTVKFTPERIEQIRNLVERGVGREEIAQIVGCTVGSLQVTCSRLGISLRRRRLDNGVRYSPAPVAEPPACPAPALAASPAASRGSLGIELAITGPNGHSRLPVALPPGVMTDLALTCAVSGTPLAEFIARALTKALKA
jgi:hypothetical protein